MNDDMTFNELDFLRTEVRRLRKALSRQTPGIDLLLKRRGFRVYKKEPPDDLLIPAKRHLNGYYQMLHKYSFRLVLRDVIKRKGSFTLEDVTRYATPRVTEEYLDYLLSVKLIKKRAREYVLAKGTITSFGATLEWYVAEVFKREFGQEAVWGVKFKRPKVGGDYDVIAKFDGSLFYVEVKSSPPKQIYDSEIAAFLDRVEDFAPAIAVFLMDTELRMKDKLVPMFEKELKERYKDPPAVVRMERELFHIRDRVFIVNAKESIVRNFEKVVSWYYQKVDGLS
ncbi:MAG TPA: hypothetical protein VGB23_06595 [Nitrospirota bacterium]|jgi:hypothetical protein